MSKKPRKPRQLPNDGLDKGTPEYQAKVTLVKVETDQKSFAYRVKDQRPIDKYHRWYVEDEAKGIADANCRGLNHDQFRVADRMFSLYARTVLLPAQGSRPMIGRFPLRSRTAKNNQNQRLIELIVFEIEAFMAL